MWWLLEALGHRRKGLPLGAVEASLWLPLLKVAALPVGVWTELPNSGWHPMAQVMGWAHIMIYVGFALSGVVDLLHRVGRVTASATRLAFAGAALNGAFLMGTHGNHLAVEYIAHLLIAASFALAGLAALGEAALRRSPGAHWLRIWALLTLGSWWVVTGWMLFRSGWDLTDEYMTLWVFFAYSVTSLATAAVLIGCVAGIQPRSAVPGEA